MHIKTLLFAFAIMASVLTSCVGNHQELKSPDGKIAIAINLENGEPTYQVNFNGKSVIDPSTLGFDFTNMPAMRSGWEIVSEKLSSSNSSWEMPWGEKRVVEDHFNQLALALVEKQVPYRKMNLVFKAYNDGIGFRYEFPEQEAMKEFLIAEENTEFNLTGDHKVWWIPGDWDIFIIQLNSQRLMRLNCVVMRVWHKHQFPIMR